MAANIQATFSFVLKSVTPNEAIKASKAYDHTFELQVQSSHDEKFVAVPQISGQWVERGQQDGRHHRRHAGLGAQRRHRHASSP